MLIYINVGILLFIYFFKVFVCLYIRTHAPRRTFLCAPTPACWSRFSPSCCSRASQNLAPQRTCAICGRRSRRNRRRKTPRSIFSNKSLCVSSWVGLCRPIGGSTWWQASSRLQCSTQHWRFRCPQGECICCFSVIPWADLQAQWSTSSHLFDKA